MKIQLSEHFTYPKLLRFILPAVLTSVFTSVYGAVDSFFISNYAGKEAFAALIIILPLVSILVSVGFMMGEGGTAIVSRVMGEGNNGLANRYFTLIVIATTVISTAIAAVAFIFIRPISVFLGAEGKLIDLCALYGRIQLAALPFFTLQILFQSFFVAAGKQKLGLAITFISGISNILLDYLLVVLIPLGIAGAAIATVTSQIIGGLIPLIYFLAKNDSRLRFTATKFYGKAIGRSMTNGSAGFMTNITASAIHIIYNKQLMALAGENGITAYGAIMNVATLFLGVFTGYTVATAPIVAYNYGAQNARENRNILIKSAITTVTIGFIMFALSSLLARPLASVFIGGYDGDVLEMATTGMRIYAFSFMLCGFSRFAISFFAALNNGLISGTLSFLRSFVFQALAVLIIPIFLGLSGIWVAMLVAELLAFSTSVIFILKNRKKYGYL